MLATGARTVDVHLEESHNSALASLHGRDRELSGDGLPPCSGRRRSTANSSRVRPVAISTAASIAAG